MPATLRPAFRRVVGPRDEPRSSAGANLPRSRRARVIRGDDARSSPEAMCRRADLGYRALVTRLSHAASRLRDASPASLIAAGGALAFAAMAVELATASWPDTPAADLAVAALFGACLAASGWWPAEALICAGILMPAQAALGADIADNSGTLALACVALVFAAAARTPRRRFWTAFAVFAVGLHVMAQIDSGDDPMTTFLWVSIVLLGFPAAAGQSIRWRAEANAELRRQAAELERNREARVAAAALAERRRIAGELHDVVAHDVAVMLVQAQAAARMIRAGRPGAPASIEEIEHTGREALTEMRRLLGVLRRGDESPSLAPPPTLDAALALADAARADGFDATVSRRGAPIALPPWIELTGYRIIESAMTSIREHSDATHAHAGLSYGSAALEIELRSDGVVTEACLEGIRERARSCDGSVATTVSAEGHGRLRVVLPLDPAEAPA